MKVNILSLINNNNNNAPDLFGDDVDDDLVFDDAAFLQAAIGFAS